MTYTYDYEYLIHLINCGLTGAQPDEKPERISFENVYQLGVCHEVANIAYLAVERLSAKPEPQLLNEWKVNYYFSVERDSRQSAEREELVELLHSHGIRTLEAQGTVTKTLYPQPELRMMSDIDFIIDEENLDEAEELMRSLGMPTNRKQPMEFDAIDSNGMMIEFHTDYFTKNMYNRPERYYDSVNGAFSHAEPSADDALSYVPDDTYFYLYSLLHTVKHFETAGCGIRRIMDLYILNRSFAPRDVEASSPTIRESAENDNTPVGAEIIRPQPQRAVDMQLINDVIDNNGFRKSVDTLFAVERLWFEGIEPDEPLDEAIGDIIRAGNHGASELLTRNQIRSDRESGKHFVKLRKIYDFIFPSREYICLTYPECRERGYSLARCRLYRITHVFRKASFEHITSYLKTLFRVK